MSIIRQKRMCACGREFKVRSESGTEQCWPCHLTTVEADYLEHAAKVEAMPVPAWADVKDPFLNRWGARLDTTHTGKDPLRAVKP